MCKAPQIAGLGEDCESEHRAYTRQGTQCFVVRATLQYSACGLDQGVALLDQLLIAPELQPERVERNVVIGDR